LKSILERIAEQGVKVRMDPEVNARITASFQDRDIQGALDSILRGLNHVLVWETIPGPLGDLPRLAEIHVFRPGRKDGMETLERSPNLTIARNPRDGSLYVDNEILIRLREGSTLQDLQGILNRIHGWLEDSYPLLGLYKVRLPPGSDVPGLSETLKEHPRVAETEPNFVYPLPVPEAGDDSTQRAVPDVVAHTVERDVSIAVLDSGLAANSSLRSLVKASLDALDPERPISDSLGHGTQMAYIASGVVRPLGVRAPPEAQRPIIAVRAFDDKGFTSSFLIMEAMDFAMKNGARVMSLSWGSETRSRFLDEAFTRASKKGLIFVASAGNEPTGRPVYPAAYESVIGVGATSPDGTMWEKSNSGDFVSLYAPGFAFLPVGYKGDPGTYGGTSISAAFVANLAANILSQTPKATMEDVVRALAGR